MRGMSNIKFSNLDTNRGMGCYCGCEILYISTNPLNHYYFSLIPMLFLTGSTDNSNMFLFKYVL